MTFLLIAAAILCVCAFFDEYTTQMGIKTGWLVEGNPVFVWIYGPRPTPLQGYGVGAITIGLEFLLAGLMVHLGAARNLISFGCLVQSAFHIYCIFSNYKLDTGKDLL